jgi:hypothetical protein
MSLLRLENLIGEDELDTIDSFEDRKGHKSLMDLFLHNFRTNSDPINNQIYFESAVEALRNMPEFNKAPYPSFCMMFELLRGCLLKVSLNALFNETHNFKHFKTTNSGDKIHGDKFKSSNKREREEERNPSSFKPKADIPQCNGCGKSHNDACSFITHEDYNKSSATWPKSASGQFYATQNQQSLSWKTYKQNDKLVSRPPKVVPHGNKNPKFNNK